MGNVTLIRRFTRAAPGALNVFAFATDDVTGLTFIRVSSNNAILDIVNDPDPAGGLNYQIRILKNTIDTGRYFSTFSLSPLSAGRVAVGPIALSAGDYYFSVAQTLGGVAATSFLVKFARAP